MNTKIEINPEEITQVREKLMKCKVICLDKMGKHPLMNPKYFSNLEKDRLLVMVREMFDNYSIKEITEKFNEVCSDKLFNNNTDYSNYSVYVDNRFPEQQNKIEEEKPAFEKLVEDIKTNKLLNQDIAGNTIESL